MRGPMVRIKSDIRRLWRCPQCNYERRASLTQTTVRCHCSKDSPFMQLVEEQRAARPIPEELPPYFEYEEDPNDIQEDIQNEAAEQELKSVVEVPEPETIGPPDPNETNEMSTAEDESAAASTLDPQP